MEYNNEEVLEGLKIAEKMEELDYSSYIKEIVVLLNEFNYFTDGNLISLKKEKKVDKLSNLMDPLTNAIKLKSFLSSKIYGQEMAIDAVVDGIKNKVVDSTNMPAHMFIFLGPPASGKTYFSQLIGNYLEL